MKKTLLILSILIAGVAVAQENQIPFDPMHWRLELPTGYKASDWKLSNFQKDRFARPFFYLDSVDGGLVMEAYPAEGTSTATYTRNNMREQMEPGSNETNWTLKEGAVLEADFQMLEMSKDERGKYYRTILFQIDGRTTAEQTKELGLSKPVSMPFLKIYWQNDRLRINRRVLKDDTVVGDALLAKSSWEEDGGTYSREKVGFERNHIRIEVKKGRVTIQINEEKPVTYSDFSVSHWYFENYFTVGNYLQSKDEGAKSAVKYFNISVTHE